MKLLILDASGFVYRMYYAAPPVSRSDETPVGAIKGWCETLWSLVNRSDYTHIVNVEDAGHSGRQDISSIYKANRPDKPDDLRSQLKLLPEATASFNISTIKVPGYEADDVIASLAKQAIMEDGMEVEIHSSDKDILQLLRDGVSIYDPLKKQKVTPEVCRQRFGVWPGQMIDYQSLVGDSSDNIKGVPGVGAKTAATLLNDYASLDEIYNALFLSPETFTGTRRIGESLLVHHTAAMTARKLVTLQDDIYPLPDIELTMRRVDPDPTRLRAYLREMEFNLLGMDVAERYGVAV